MTKHLQEVTATLHEQGQRFLKHTLLEQFQLLNGDRVLPRLAL
jgi:hypothetical protein